LNTLQAIQALVLLNQLLPQLPALIAAVKQTLSETDEAVLKAELAKLRSDNDASYDAAVAALQGIIKP